MKNTRKLIGIIALIAVIGFSMAACDDSNGDDENGGNNSDGSNNGGGGNGKWRISKVTGYGIAFQGTTPGSGAPSDQIINSDAVYNWTIYRYTNNTNYEQEYTVTYNQTNSLVSETMTSSQTVHITRNGQNYVYNSETTSGTQTTTQTSTSTYDSASGLTLTYNTTQTQTNTNAGTTYTSTTEYTYNIDLISDSGGIKTYKVYYNSLISNGTSIDISSNPAYQSYTEYKIQNGRTIETKSFSADGTLNQTATYTLSDNAVIRAKLGDYELYSYTSSSSIISNQYQTVEVLSDSATELVIRQKTFSNNIFAGQNDYTYEKVN